MADSSQSTDTGGDGGLKSTTGSKLGAADDPALVGAQEISGLFAQTEAAIRGKLMELSYPFSNSSGDKDSAGAESSLVPSETQASEGRLGTGGQPSTDTATTAGSQQVSTEKESSTQLSVSATKEQDSNSTLYVTPVTVCQSVSTVFETIIEQTSTPVDTHKSADKALTVKPTVVQTEISKQTAAGQGTSKPSAVERDTVGTTSVQPGAREDHLAMCNPSPTTAEPVTLQTATGQQEILKCAAKEKELLQPTKAHSESRQSTTAGLEIFLPTAAESETSKSTVDEEESSKDTVLEDQSSKPTVVDDQSSKPTVVDDQSSKPTVVEDQSNKPTVAEDEETYKPTAAKDEILKPVAEVKTCKLTAAGDETQKTTVLKGDETVNSAVAEDAVYKPAIPESCKPAVLEEGATLKPTAADSETRQLSDSQQKSCFVEILQFPQVAAQAGGLMDVQKQPSGTSTPRDAGSPSLRTATPPCKLVGLKEGSQAQAADPRPAVQSSNTGIAALETMVMNVSSVAKQQKTVASSGTCIAVETSKRSENKDVSEAGETHSQREESAMDTSDSSVVPVGQNTPSHSLSAGGQSGEVSEEVQDRRSPTEGQQIPLEQAGNKKASAERSTAASPMEGCDAQPFDMESGIYKPDCGRKAVGTDNDTGSTPVSQSFPPTDSVLREPASNPSLTSVEEIMKITDVRSEFGADLSSSCVNKQPVLSEDLSSLQKIVERAGQSSTVDDRNSPLTNLTAPVSISNIHQPVNGGREPTASDSVPALDSSNEAGDKSTEGCLPVIANTFSIRSLADMPAMIKQEQVDACMDAFSTAAQTPSSGMDAFSTAAPTPYSVAGKSLLSKPPIKGARKSWNTVQSSNPVQSSYPVQSRSFVVKDTSMNEVGIELIRIGLPGSLPATQSTVTATDRKKLMDVMSTVAPVTAAQPVVTSAGDTLTVGPVTSSAKNPGPAKTSSSKPEASSSKLDGSSSKPEATALGTDSINIFSVGDSTITELIARKNPIPVYKPPPIPASLKSVLHSESYQCYECGDTFYHRSSLTQHLSRYSMKIKYRCEWCGKEKSPLLFYNKCMLLTHLRGHMSIRKTQAVPIHIKSNSIEISSVLPELSKPFQWFNEMWVTGDKTVVKVFLPNEVKNKTPPDEIQTKTPVETKLPTITVGEIVVTQRSPVGEVAVGRQIAPMYTCDECREKFESIEARKEHLKKTDKKEHMCCGICQMYLQSKCSYLSHRRIHNNEHPFFCPECGMGFGSNAELFHTHLKYQCFHLSNFMTYKCPKCTAEPTSDVELTTHLLISLEQYYKCCKCPMALKSWRTFMSHYKFNHATGVEISTEAISWHEKAKIIYRCHVCDTLIDDRSYLLVHIEKHCKEIQESRKFMFHCLQCGLLRSTKEELVSHFHKTHKKLKRTNSCTICRKVEVDTVTAIGYTEHILQTHIFTRKFEPAVLCDHCGLICHGVNNLRSHDCHMMAAVFRVTGDEATAKTPSAILPKRSGINLSLNKAVPVEDSTYKHISAELGGLSGICKSCGYHFAGKNSRIHHIRGHRNSGVYICINCDRMDFATYGDLRSHEIICGLVAATKRGRKPKTGMMIPGPSKKTGLAPGPGNVASVAEEVQHTLHACQKCHQVLGTRESLEEHTRTEHGIHPCHLCGLMFKSRKNLNKHLMVHHEGKKRMYFCHICRNHKISKSFSSPTLLKRHLSRKHRVRSVDKSMIVPEYPGLEDKEPRDGKKRQHEADSAGDTVEPVKKLRVAGGTTYNCAKCDFTNTDHVAFVEHIRQHKTNNTVQCLECGLCFAVVPSLKKHLFMVHKVRDFDSYFEKNKIDELVDEEESCSDVEAEKQSSGPSSAAPTETEEEEEEEEAASNPLECKVCYKVFESEKVLQRHMRNHGMAFIKKTRRALAASSSRAAAREKEESLKMEKSSSRPSSAEKSPARSSSRPSSAEKSLPVRVKIEDSAVMEDCRKVGQDGVPADTGSTADDTSMDIDAHVTADTVAPNTKQKLE